MAESLGIIGLAFCKDFTIRDMDNPSGALVGIYPIANFVVVN